MKIMTHMNSARSYVKPRTTVLRVEQEENITTASRTVYDLTDENAFRREMKSTEAKSDTEDTRRDGS